MGQSLFEHPVGRKVMPDREYLVEAIRTYCRAETEKDRAAWMALFAPEVVHEDPVGVTTRSGLTELAELWELVARSDVKLWLTDDVIVCGSEAVALMACETGPAERRRKTSPIVDLFRFDAHGKIASVRAFYRYA
jgi:steroid Delta-isomerase